MAKESERKRKNRAEPKKLKKNKNVDISERCVYIESNFVWRSCFVCLKCHSHSSQFNNTTSKQIETNENEQWAAVVWAKASFTFEKRPLLMCVFFLDSFFPEVLFSSCLNNFHIYSFNEARCSDKERKRHLSYVFDLIAAFRSDILHNCSFMYFYTHKVLFVLGSFFYFARAN